MCFLLLIHLHCPLKKMGCGLFCDSCMFIVFIVFLKNMTKLGQSNLSLLQIADRFLQVEHTVEVPHGPW